MANTNPPVKLMMLALAAPQEQQTPPQREVFESGQQLVIFLGVQKLESANGSSAGWDEKKWYVGLAKLDEFLSYISNENPNNGREENLVGKNLFEKFLGKEIVETWQDNKEIEKVGISDGSGSDTKDRFLDDNKTLWIDKIYRVFFFNGKQDNGVYRGCQGDALNQPLLRLDTAAWVENMASEKKPGPEWVVSRLRLTCDSSWLEEGEPKSNLLTRFRLVAHIPVAVNSHNDDDEGEDARAKRYDTRVILVADSSNTGGSQSLWANNENEDRHEGIIFPHFNQLHLAFSESNGFSGGNLTNETLEGNEGNSGLQTLKKLTDTKKPICADNINETNNSERVNIPILSCFTDLKENQPSGFINKIRRRQLCLKVLKDKRFALRIESHLIVKDCDRQKKLWNAVVKPFTELVFPGQLNKNEDESGWFLVQEQLEEDIFFDLQTPAIKPSRWHLNVRIDPELKSHNIEDLIFEKCNNISQAVRQGLYLARPATGVSFLPGIDVSQQDCTGNPWQLNGRLEQISHRRRIWLDDEVDWQSQAPDPEGRSLTFESFTPVTKNNLLGDRIGELKKVKLPIKFIKDHDMFVGVNGQSVLGSNQDYVLELSESAQLEKGTVRFGLALKPEAVNENKLILSNFILGALEFRLGSKPKINIQIALQPKPSEQESELNSPLESFMQIDIENFKPVVQDQTNEDKGHEEEQALILELPKIINSDGVEEAQGVAQGEHEGGNNAEGNAAFRLEIRESVGEWIEINKQDDANNSIWQDQKLEVKLIQNPIAANNKASLNPLLVLDRKPWRAVLVAGEKFTSGGAGDGNNTIAKYMPGDDGLYSWQFFDQKETVTWLLPPQTLGEAMEKRRSEIDIAEGMPAPMRFGSNSILVIDPTFRNPKNYREAGWNLRRILAKITDAPSGALVKELRLELIYGLLTQINPDQEVPVWVTEMQAVIGRAPSTRTVGGGNSFADYGHYVQQILQAQGQRLAVDKLWSGRPEASFLWKENLQFTLRTYEDSAEGTKNKGLQTPLKFPATSGYPNREGANDDPGKSAIVKTFRDDNAVVNFPGGVAWAIETANILGEIYVQGTSNDGQIGNVHLSALGGWGNQRAVYGKSIFETETTMGRLQTYRLERLGRIGGLYNKAKHVIEFQRTVAPSDQFASSQDQLLDRPVLRKTREYIQILEPKKAFSESGEATYETGFLLGSEFVTQRIFVDSDWGRDVRSEGWMVPLWKKQNEQNSYSYPPPEVFLTVVGEDGTKRSVKIESVEKLVFYTSTRKDDTAETIDDWPAVEGIDFCDLPLPSVKIKRPTDADSENQLHDGFLPKAATVPFGYDKLTLILSESSVPVRITAGRSNEGPAAPIRAVTIGRAAPAKNSKPDEELQIKRTEFTDINNEIRAVFENWAGRVVAELGCNQNRQNETDDHFRPQLQKLVDSSKKSFITKDNLNQEIQTRVRKIINTVFLFTLADAENILQLVINIESGMNSRLNETLNSIQSAHNLLYQFEDNAGDTGQVYYNKLAKIIQDTEQSISNFIQLPSESNISFKIKQPKKDLIDDIFDFSSLIIPTEDWKKNEINVKDIVLNYFSTELIDTNIYLKSLLESLNNDVNAYLTQIRNSVAEVTKFRNNCSNAILFLINYLTSNNHEIPLTDEVKNAKNNIYQSYQEIILQLGKIPRNTNYNWEPIQGKVISYTQKNLKPFTDLESDQNLCTHNLLDKIIKVLIYELPNIPQVDAKIFDATFEAIRKLNNNPPADWTKNAEQIINESIDFIDNKLASQLLPLQNQLKLETNKVEALYQRADNTLRVLRAAGPPPKVEGLVINRPQVAYVFDLVKPVVDMTPAVALANRVVATKRAIEQTADAAADLLQPFGVRLPVEGLAADLLPADLGETSLSKLLPDMAGLKLDALLPSLKLPDLSDKVKITRGFDKAKRQAWLNATVDIPLKGTTTLLSFGPLSFSLIDGKISARSRMTIDQNGRTETDAKGEITGNWKVVAGGIEVVTFEKTPLVFEKSGKLDFKLSTKRVKLSPQLQFITNLLEQVKKSIPPGIEPIYRDGLPAGIRCLLAMDLPPISTGVFGITDLTLGCSFGVYAYPEFEITSSLDVGTQLSPFTLAVWLLNGGGYISLQLRYVPMAKPGPLIIFSLDLSMVAGVGIGFAVGVVSGAIWIQIGCGIKLELSTGKNSKKVTTIKVMLLIRGNVDIAGIATAGIQLLMEASYNGADMVAKGILRVSIRVSWLYTFKTQEKVKYKLAGDNKSKSDEKEYADSYA